jgi:hypothetical protein
MAQRVLMSAKRLLTAAVSLLPSPAAAVGKN